MEARHKKEVKALEGAYRAALKQAKQLKKAAANGATQAAKEDYQTKLAALQAKHAQEIAEAASGESKQVANEPSPEKETPSTSKQEQEEQTERQRKQEKARKKKERKKEKEAQRQAEIEEETANAGPSLKDVELQQLQGMLDHRNLQIVPVAADGHCLYRAVAAQVLGQESDYPQMRTLCADTMQTHADEFAPFCEFNETDLPDFDAYLHQVRSSAAWGGHLELRALAVALQRTIQVFSVSSGSDHPLEIQGTENIEHEPILLSYHLHYYALGEHYNRVVPKENAAES